MVDSGMQGTSEHKITSVPASLSVCNTTPRLRDWPDLTDGVVAFKGSTL